MSEVYYQRAKQEIEKWETRGPGFVAKAGDVLLWPAQKAAELLIPHGVQDQVGKAVESCLSGLGAATKHTISADNLTERVKLLEAKYGIDLRAADEIAAQCRVFGVGVAAAEGGLAGAGGAIAWPVLVADIPALFGIANRTIQEIAVVYGYDIHTPEEQEYMLRILQVGSTGDVKAKLEFMVGLKQIEQILLKVSWKQMNAALAAKEISRLSALAALRQFAKTLGINVTKRKALQALPAIGGIVGATFNGAFLNDVAEAAYMSYRRRYIAEKSEI